MSEEQDLQEDTRVSFNGFLILEPYKYSGKIKAKTTGGFASIEQKTNLTGLKLLTHGFIQMGQNVRMLPSGTTIYFPEEVLHSSTWAKTTYTSDNVEGDFILAPASALVMVDQG